MPEPGPLIDRSGRRADLLEYPPGGGPARVRLPSGAELEVPAAALTLRGDGGYRLDGDLADLARSAGPGDGPDPDAALVIPRVEERARVEKRPLVTGRVRVTKQVTEHRETVDEPLLAEEVEVRRVPVERWLDGPAGPRQEGDTLVVPVLEEVLVVEKRLRVKEELHITRRSRERHHPQEVTLRREEVRVERDAPDPAAAPGVPGPVGPADPAGGDPRPGPDARSKDST